MDRIIIAAVGIAAVAALIIAAVQDVGPQVEADLASRGQELLAEQSHHWAELSVRGRELTLAGSAPSKKERDSALLALSQLSGVRTVQSQALVEAPMEALVEAPTTQEFGLDTELLLECQTELDGLLADQKILFEVSSAAIRAESSALLEQLAEVLTRCPDAQVEIVGHTDSQGTEEFNRMLSQTRAEAVRSYLMRIGTRADRLVARGLGESMPIYANSSDDGRARNRRIEFNVQGM